jgi:hypothetical protein
MSFVVSDPGLGTDNDDSRSIFYCLADVDGVPTPARGIRLWTPRAQVNPDLVPLHEREDSVCINQFPRPEAIVGECTEKEYDAYWLRINEERAAQAKVYELEAQAAYVQHQIDRKESLVSAGFTEAQAQALLDNDLAP